MLLYGIIFFSVTSRPISPQGKFSFSFFLFFSLFCFTMAISGKVTFFSSSLSFLPFFPIRYDRNWPRSKILSNLRSFPLHLRYCETTPSLPTTNRATIYGKIDKRLVCGTIDGVGSTAVFFFPFFQRKIVTCTHNRMDVIRWRITFFDVVLEESWNGGREYRYSTVVSHEISSMAEPFDDKRTLARRGWKSKCVHPVVRHRGTNSTN